MKSLKNDNDNSNRHMNRRRLLQKCAVLAGGITASRALNVLARDDVPGRRTGNQDLITEYINYSGKTGDIRAYSARPEGDKKLPAVIVIHENKGLQPHIEDVTRRVAREGFLAIAPDALSPLGGTPADPNQATTLINQLNEQSTIQNFVAAVQYLKTAPFSTGDVGCMGFCWGGGMTNQTAVNAPDLKAGVPFYGSQPASADVPKIKASLLLHYGSLDSRINAGIAAFEAALKAAGIDYRLYIYEGAAHAFFNDTNPDRYNKEAAELAWQRTVDFFNEKLRDGTGRIREKDIRSQQLPRGINITGNYPNPFNSATSIDFSLDTAGDVSLDIVNVHGRLVVTLLAKRLQQGAYAVTWNGRDVKNSAVPSGTYFCRLRMGGFGTVHKMLLIR